MPVSANVTPISITSHRGGAGYAPENTMGAFQRSIDVGVAQWVDFDVQRSKDGVLVVVHDLTLGRTSNVGEVFPDRARDRVGDFTLADLRRLDVGSWFRPAEFPGERIPTFSDALDFLAGRVGITFELKHPRLYPGLENDVADALRTHGLADSDLVEIGSFEHDSLERMHACLPTIAVSGAFRTASELEVSSITRVLSSVSFAPQHTSEQLALADKLGLPVGVGMNSPQRMRRALSDGITRLSSDYPDVLARVAARQPPFELDEHVAVDDVAIDAESGIWTAAIRNVSTRQVSVRGWYLWNGVATPIDRGGATMAPGELRSVALDPPRARDVSSIRALALHDENNHLRTVHEYRAAPRPASS